ncbi:MAG: sulfurtransferase TusA family protein [Clostridia bacterium]|nr:sulfurtransferase TusA family protein [Clostridia bacterium]
MLNVDARGMSCPQPVLMVKKAIASGGSALEVVVDNNTAKNNVQRFLKNNGFTSIEIKEEGENITLKASK